MDERCPAEGSAPPEEIRAELERILDSQTLAGSDQLKRFLRLIVDRTLNGHPELLKEYNLGLEVFHRPPNYDPKVDPIVRVQARRLRVKLGEYYASEGARNPFVIQIPKGAYVPVFDPQKSVIPEELPLPPARPKRKNVWAIVTAAVFLIVLAILLAKRDSSIGSAETDRSIAVLPLEGFTESGTRPQIADMVAEVLTTELGRSKQLRVLSRTTASRYRNTKMSLPEIARSLQVRWVVEGGVGIEGTRGYVKLRCVDSLTDRKIWANVFKSDLSDLVAIGARAADGIERAVVAELRSDNLRKSSPTTALRSD